jgi:2-desacetyl-2-hydroxyethyl bacteriochlorophyllide A dehydrogenase
MRAVVTTGIDELEMTERPEPHPQGRSLVEVLRAGICGTDLKILSGAIAVDHPRILGHELFGRVSTAAPGGELASGTPVLIDPTVSCLRCTPCRRGLEHLCERGGLMGRDLDGGFADLIAVDERQLLPVADEIEADEAALLQVLGTCVHGQLRIDVQPGRPAAVIGLGVTGLLHLQVLKARGASPIIAITRSEEKRATAAELGADVTAPPDEAAAAVAESTKGKGVDVVVESVGKAQTLAQAIGLVSIGGRILMYGIINESEAALPFYDLYLKEVDLINTRAAAPRDYQAAIDLVARRAVTVRPLISASIPLADVQVAFDRLAHEPGILKVILNLES